MSEFDWIEVKCEMCSDNPISDSTPCKACDGKGKQYIYVETVIVPASEPNSNEIG